MGKTNRPDEPPSSRKPAPSSAQASVAPRGPAGEARRILVIDDTPAIHDDFRKTLCPPRSAAGARELDAMEADLFGGPSAPRAEAHSFELFTASQGREGYELAARTLRVGRPITMAFVDMRMPPGWDGVETTAKLLALDPDLEVVICSAYSDYSWHEVINVLKKPELRMLRKPFEAREVLDLAWTLTSRGLRRRAAKP